MQQIRFRPARPAVNRIVDDLAVGFGAVTIRKGRISRLVARRAVAVMSEIKFRPGFGLRKFFIPVQLFDMKISISYIMALTGILILVGCNREVTPQPTDAPPEAAYRRFMLSLLAPKQSEIAELILDHPDAEILWEGAYPPQAAAALAAQYRTMQITRDDANNQNTPESVSLNSSAFPSTHRFQNRR